MDNTVAADTNHTDNDTLTSQQQADHDDLASAVGAAVSAHQLDLGHLDDPSTHHFHHQLKAPDFGQHDPSSNGHELDISQVDVSELNIPQISSGDDDEDHRDFNVEGLDNRPSDGFEKWSKPLTMRKACDLCHAAKQVSVASVLMGRAEW